MKDNKTNEEINKEEASASEEDVEETTAETEEETTTDDDFDYKSEYEKLKTNSDQKDYTWEKLRDENKELKEKLGGKVEKEDPNDIKSIVKKEIGEIKKELFGDKLDREIEGLTENVYAQKLVKLKLKEHPTMSTKEAWTLISAGKTETQIKEAKRAIDSNNRKGDGSGAGNKDTKSTEPVTSPENMAIIKRMGLKWDGTNFSKKDGKFGLDKNFNQIVLK